MRDADILIDQKKKKKNSALESSFEQDMTVISSPVPIVICTP